MVDIHKVHRRMEHFLGYDPSNEIRPETKAVLDEKDKSLLMQKRYRRHSEENPGEDIGTFIYDFKNKTEKFFRYKSRGKK